MKHLPSEVARYMRTELPGYPHVVVTPRDADEARCPAYAADHYEVTAYYVSTVGGRALLDRLQAALDAQPDVYRSTVIIGDGSIDSDWPVRYQSPKSFRPQVRALYRDPASVC